MGPSDTGGRDNGMCKGPVVEGAWSSRAGLDLGLLLDGETEESTCARSTLHAFLVGTEVLWQGAGNPLDTLACPGPARGPANI